MDANEDLRRLARRAAGRKIGFYIHALVYLLVNLLLIGVQQATHPALPWAVFPAAGWGLGLAIHGLAVFFAGPASALRGRIEADELARLQRERQANLR